MQPSQRRERIVDLVRERESASVEELAQVTKASAETIRRDLGLLAAQGLLSKVHGGASLANLTPRAGSGTFLEGSFQSRLRRNIREKRAIARCAAQLFFPGDSLFIDTGTTTVAFAEELAKIFPLTVVTNSCLIAQQVARHHIENQVILIGGEHRLDAGENVGPLALAQIEKFRCTHAVLTAGAVDAHGVSDYDLQEAAVAMAMIYSAEYVTILADSSKVDRAGLMTICSFVDLDRLVTDKPLPTAIEEASRSQSVQLHVASAT